MVASKRRRVRGEARRGGLNPLHCGAVVASRVRPTGVANGCSLNPLHCGAVVASPWREHRRGAVRRVSIPFIAGQWSLRVGDCTSCFFRSSRLNPLHCGAVVASPFLFLARHWVYPRGLNPLHCGAVVASSHPFHIPRRRKVMSQSPSLQGSGRFGRYFLKDLGSLPSLNPLHCGAVVASFPRPGAALWGELVSIPFIAGQWSLHDAILILDVLFRVVSQSPSLRGSGRFGCLLVAVVLVCLSQSPSLRGSGRFRSARSSPGRKPKSLNPLHCGAVVASRRTAAPPARYTKKSQSPSLRGSGRFAVTALPPSPPRTRLNPLHCGAVVASKPHPGRWARWSSLNPLHCGAVVASRRGKCSRRSHSRVSIPFIAGQWSLRWVYFLEVRGIAYGLNPLHCGAVVASR